MLRFRKPCASQKPSRLQAAEARSNGSSSTASSSPTAGPAWWWRCAVGHEVARTTRRADPATVGPITELLRMSGYVRVASPAADRDAADAAPWIVDESAISSWHPELRLAGPADRRRRAAQQRDPVGVRRPRPAAYRRQRPRCRSRHRPRRTRAGHQQRDRGRGRCGPHRPNPSQRNATARSISLRHRQPVKRDHCHGGSSPIEARAPKQPLTSTWVNGSVEDPHEPIPH
jgi:hypothetical protein